VVVDYKEEEILDALPEDSVDVGEWCWAKKLGGKAG
jgi:hypothetical protein